MEQQQGYRDRLAEIEAAVERAQPSADVTVERAAGLLAGQVGCRVSEAHAYLLRRAAEQGLEAREVAAAVLAALEGQVASAGTGRLRAAVDQALQPPRPSARWRSRRLQSGSQPIANDWAAVMQQVLDAVPGNHTVLLPLRNEADEIVDFVLAAVSPSIVDLSGRQSPQIVGRRVSEVYPTVVHGPVWDAWREAILDGLPREVGPVPYSGEADRTPAQLSITVRVQPVGPGLLNTWVRHDEQAHLAERIAQTERLGSLGWGEADLLTGAVVWSDEMYRIFERDPGLGPLSSEEQDALTLPEDEPLRRAAAEAFGRQQTVDITYRIRVGGRIKHVRGVVDAVRDVNGQPLRLFGIVQDVTARETSRVRLAEVEQQLREHQHSLAAEHQLAAELQQIVLPIPAAPIDLPGLRVAVRYLPAEQASRVGGDWYHAATTDDGNVMLAVGDVAGHGLRAAAAMAQLRHVLAALTITTTTDPAELLTQLNRLLYAAGSVTTATAIVGRYHPVTRTLVWAQAGHPAPLHTRAGATVQPTRPAGPLLGALRMATYHNATLTLDPGDLLLFYTDGLIEHRSHTLEQGIAPIIATLNRISAAGSQQPLADLLAQMRRANPDDDTCILAARPLLTDAPAGPISDDGHDD
jgi:serine phosphatase RsbU (regulator of sigma subunit)